VPTFVGYWHTTYVVGGFFPAGGPRLEPARRGADDAGARAARS